MIGYFEAFNTERPCLTMDVTYMDTSKLTHIHFAFATVTEERNTTSLLKRAVGS